MLEVVDANMMLMLRSTCSKSEERDHGEDHLRCEVCCCECSSCNIVEVMKNSSSM